ncbi:FEKKY domain-containing protein [Hymenobacter yonginensis]|uniref:Uncharacterized protein n=1 Tax=Hymenobacter yonginensis TaxID=748197 RepID=A0ABY7PJ24_9BACT|nr:hypothetical protein [Hymenobacter yonginensis]WBO83209.1 hypothetical protein O9Z63_12550 [Hymenobacter yonginensis]
MRVFNTVQLIGLWLLVPAVALSQRRIVTDAEANASGANQLTFSSADCSRASSLAAADIANHLPFLILQSGFAPQSFAADTVFENSYGVFYREEGCTGSVKECVVLYNQQVFHYLTEKYGRQWLRTVRKDVVGFREWKKAQR